MPPLFFTNPWMLAGLAALSVPIIIHLLLRRKKTRVRFSTIQFFLRQDEQASARRKLRHWFLLALRILILAALVLAFARPWLRDEAAAGEGRPQRQMVLVLDRSLSMQANVPGGTKWDKAKDEARKRLADLGPNDRAALVTCGFQAETLSAWAPPAAVNQRVAELEPASGAASLSDALQQVQHLLSFRDPSAEATLCIISDFQRNACQNLGSHPLPREIKIEAVSVGDLLTPNLAVTGLQGETRDGSGPHAILSSYSDEACPKLELELRIDGTNLSSASLELEAGASVITNLVIPPLQPGWHDIAVRIAGRDSLKGDDARFATLFVPEPARVAMVESRRSSRVFEEESFFVATALDPSQGTTNGVPSRFTVEKVSMESLAARLAGGQRSSGWDLVVVPGLGPAAPGLSAGLLNYVRTGGGLLLFLGGGANPAQYNNDLQALMPSPVGTLEQNPDPLAPWRIGQCDTNHAAFAPFRAPNSGDLSLARFWQRFSLPPCDPGLVLASFEDGVPLVLAGAVGSGRVAVVNSSADTSGNDWPKHKTFVPWLHGIAMHLAGLANAGLWQEQPSLLPGIDQGIDLGPSAAGKTFHLAAPNGKPKLLIADAKGRLRDPGMDVPGVYSLKDEAGTEMRRFAVNAPSHESDLEAIATSDFESQLVRTADPENAGLQAGLFGLGNGQKELWWPLLLAVLALLLVEMFVANRTLA